MLNVFFSVLPIFLLILSGWIIKKHFIHEDAFWKNVEKIVYYIFFPALLVIKLNHAELDMSKSTYALSATIIATLVVAVLVFVGKWFNQTTDATFTSVFQGAVRYNSYVFIAMSASLFGSEGVALSGIFIAYMIILTNIMSVVVMNVYGAGEKKSWSSIFTALVKNPLIIGAIVGVFLNLAHIKLQGFGLVFLNYLADASTPLSLLAVGAGLSLFVETTRIIATGYASVLKLFVLPALTVMLLKFFGVSGVIAQIAILYSAVPTAGNAYILSKQMGGDSEVMASIITITTLLSIVTITLVMGMTTIGS